MRQHQRVGSACMYVRPESLHRPVPAAQERAARCDQDQRTRRRRAVNIRPPKHRT